MEENKLDALIWVSYAPGNSRYNPIERMFSHLSDLLANVIIDLDPSFLTIDRQLDSVLVDLTKYWHNKTYDKFKIDCRPVFSVNGNAFDGHQQLKDKLMKNSMKHVMSEENRNIRFTLQLYLRHCVRSSYYVSFIKCKDSTCVHCTRHPVKATKAIELLRSSGGYLPWPQMTFRQTKQCPKCQLPYIFSSKADEERHMLWIHTSNTLSARKRSPSIKTKSVSKSTQRPSRQRKYSPEY
ncbi:unnamed protein product [Didymodactylos carnosus]|uniref:Uncharacterized protein n=1 Tax=Didymodactylos carnosus TaxID=1234261 RepID=A0A814Q1P1_9BILA|nr:unnamed protein product [Didymodactylos carnosus]CAF3877405.1 unnamed protein product [Didymodactylos carnosus]